MRTKRILRNLSLVALVGLGVITWRSNAFQRKFFPVKYWQKQVATLKENIELDKMMIRDTGIEMQKFQTTAAVEIAQAINIARYAGDDPEEVRKEMVEEMRANLSAHREMLEMWQETLKKDREALEQAKRQLSNHQ